MKQCAIQCLKEKKPCKENNCRMWLNYKNDLNCTFIAVEQQREMTLAEVAKRLELSIVRIKQIQDRAMQKMQKKTLLLK